MSYPSKFLICACLLLTGCNQQDTESLTRIGQKLTDGARSATDSLWDNVGDNFKTVAVPLGLQQRVAGRLLWDKGLADLKLEIKIVDGAIVLKGAVKNADQERHALELAETTLGVERVVDELRIDAN